MRVVSIRLLCLAAMVSTTLVACGEPVPLDPPNTDPGSHILVEPCGWQLSEMSFGQQATQQVTISNTGEYPLVIEAVTAQQPFAVNGTTALTLDVGSTYQLEIAFEGSAYGSLESELIVVRG